MILYKSIWDFEIKKVDFFGLIKLTRFPSYNFIWQRYLLFQMCEYIDFGVVVGIKGSMQFEQCFNFM